MDQNEVKCIGFGRTTKFSPTEHGIENARENAKGEKRKPREERRGRAGEERQEEGVEERNVKGV